MPLAMKTLILAQMFRGNNLKDKSNEENFFAIFYFNSVANANRLCPTKSKSNGGKVARRFTVFSRRIAETPQKRLFFDEARTI
jgi:hypothetical protein